MIEIESPTTLKALCEHESLRIQNKIRAAYWTGAADGLKVREEIAGVAEVEAALDGPMHCSHCNAKWSMVAWHRMDGKWYCDACWGGTGVVRPIKAELAS